MPIENLLTVDGDVNGLADSEVLLPGMEKD
jgi:hypothetical protein